MMKHKYQAYAAATQTVAKTRQIVMLYDGAIRYMQQAREAIRAGHIEERYRLLVRTSDIISGLQGCLDFENGGDVAKVLYQFYGGIETRVFSIHRTASAEACDSIIADLKQMRDVWQEIDKGASDAAANSASQQASAPSSAGDAPPLTFSA